MKINAPKENTIFIELNCEDMENLHLSYDKMDYEQPETRKAIRLLIHQAELFLGKHFTPSENFQIEALPSAQGGCLLFFTVREKLKKYTLKEYGSSLLFETEELDHVYSFFESIKHNRLPQSSISLYEKDGKYLVEVKGKIQHAMLMRLNEFFLPSKDNVKSFRPLILHNALNVFLGGFSE